MKTLGIIPVRLNSTRIFKKALLKLCGIEMVLHVAERSKGAKLLDKLIIATDSEEISRVVEARGFSCCLTSKDHMNATERICEVIENYDYDLYVQINGDEPLIKSEEIDLSISTIKSSNADWSVLLTPYKKVNSKSDFKYVIRKDSTVMYISRQDIPYDTKMQNLTMLKGHHICTFKKNTLKKYKSLDYFYENVEGHEHLRLLENGFECITAIVETSAISLDVASEIEYIENLLVNDETFNSYRKKYGC